MLPVYLSECHTWSDGEDEHEEDHNSYYDIKYFFLEKAEHCRNPSCVYAWSAHSDEHSGIVMHGEMTEKHTMQVAEFELEYAKKLVLEYAKKQRKTSIRRRDIHAISRFLYGVEDEAFIMKYHVFDDPPPQGYNLYQ